MDRRGSRRRGQALLIALIAVSTLVELALSAADHGLVALPRLRQTAYEYAGFWPGLLQGWRPNYPGQPALMFLSYGFLHGGPGHLAVNMVTLWSLGQGVAARVGGRGLAAVYAASILGGAAGFAALARTVQPMVGASGALFGLAGALVAWNLVDRLAGSETLWPILRVVLFLVAINLAMYWALDGQLAWQTHLGGFLTGMLAALALDRRPAGAG